MSDFRSNRPCLSFHCAVVSCGHSLASVTGTTHTRGQRLAEEGVRLQGSEGTLWQLTDNLGSVRDLAEYDEASGTTSVVNRNEQQLELFTLIGKLDLLNYGANSNMDFEINAQDNKGNIYFDNAAGRMVDSQTTQTLTITATENDRQAQRVVTTSSKIAVKKCEE